MTRSLPTLSPASLETSPTGLPLCPTCGRLASQHTNPMAHAFGEPYRMVRDRRARSGAQRTDFGRHFRLGTFAHGRAVQWPRPRPAIETT